jgi:hypothetical protein
MGRLLFSWAVVALAFGFLTGMLALVVSLCIGH